MRRITAILILACITFANCLSSCRKKDTVDAITGLDLVYVNATKDIVEFTVYNVDGSIKLETLISPNDSLFQYPFAPVPGSPLPFGNSAGDSIRLTDTNLCRIYYRMQSRTDYGAGEGPFGLANYLGYDPNAEPTAQPKRMVYLIDSVAFEQGRPCR